MRAQILLFSRPFFAASCVCLRRSWYFFPPRIRIFSITPPLYTTYNVLTPSKLVRISRPDSQPRSSRVSALAKRLTRPRALSFYLRVNARIYQPPPPPPSPHHQPKFFSHSSSRRFLTYSPPPLRAWSPLFLAHLIVACAFFTPSPGGVVPAWVGALRNAGSGFRLSCVCRYIYIYIHSISCRVAVELCATSDADRVIYGPAATVRPRYCRPSTCGQLLALPFVFFVGIEIGFAQASFKKLRTIATMTELYRR